jgi:hypothetical protein
MPFSRTLYLISLGLFSLVLLVGCATTGARIQARIDEKPDVFAKLTKQQKKDIKWGYVRQGYTPDMVYFAFGKPDQIITSADKGSYVWVFVDRTAVNEDIAAANALRTGNRGDSITTQGMNGHRETVWGGHTMNYPTKGAPPAVSEAADLFNGPKTQSSSDIYGTVNATENLPTIWVAFRDNAVVNVTRIGDTHNKADKTGSLGG